MHAIPIHAFNPGPITGSGNWTWLLRGQTPTVIDAGTGDPRHLAALEAALAGDDLQQVLVTHGHPDHASGAEAVAARWPRAVFRKMPWARRDDRWRVPWIALSDGDVVAAGDEMLEAVFTPGHAPDHLAFWHPASRTLFCGDLAMSTGTVWIPSSLDGSLIDYLASIRKVRALRPARMLPAHGPEIDDPDTLLQAYLDHRQEREHQVLDALRDGVTTPDAMVTRMYAGLRESLVPLARESVLAHLGKLEVEGHARREGEGWRLVR